MFNNLSFNPEFLSIERYNFEMLLLIGIFVLTEWMNRNHEQPIRGKHRFAKTVLVISMIMLFGVFSEHSDFIYFQF